MSEGGTARAVLWSLTVSAALLAWPWLLAWAARRRPRPFRSIPLTSLDELLASLDRPARPRSAVVASWLGLVGVAALLPASRGLQATDLDAGVLWLLALAASALVWWRQPGSAGLAGSLMTVGLCLTPPVMHAASLDLADIVVAQQGGMGNWFLLRDPFQLLAAAILLLTIAVTWPAAVRVPRGVDGWLRAAGAAGVPLVLSHLLVIVYAGGWWGSATFLDALTLPNTVVKTLVVFALAAWLRRHVVWLVPWAPRGLLPAAALVCAAGSVCWMVAVGAAW